MDSVAIDGAIEVEQGMFLKKVVQQELMIEGLSFNLEIQTYSVECRVVLRAGGGV